MNAATLQVMGVSRRSGISKEKQRPWKMVAYSGVLTESNGNVGVGEIVIFESDTRPAQNLEVGKTYSLSYDTYLSQGKIKPTDPTFSLVK